MPTSAPNRPLDLAEMETEPFRRVLNELDALVARDEVSYLHPGKRWEYPWALQRSDPRPGERVLDAGCGDSIFPVYLARRGCRVAAADLAFAGIIARLHDVSVGYAHGDLTALPFAEGAFDTVFCVSVIEHLPEEAVPTAMQELRRVLRPGGRLLLTTDYYDDAGAAIWYEGPGRRFRVDWRIFDEDRLRRLILGAPGFTVEGDLDLSVDWDVTKPRMRAYHGYPYTSVGVALVRS